MTFLLTKIFLKSSLQKMSDQYDLSNKKGLKTKIGIYAFLILYLLGVVGLFSYSLIDNLKTINQETTFVGLVLLLVLGVTVIQTVFSSINILYFTKDTEAILPLPLKPYQIILARTNVIIILSYIFNLIIGLFPLIIYGIIIKCNAWYYISSILALIILPVLPIILISLLVMIIMSFSKITKNKNRFQLIATLLVIALIIAFSVCITKIEQETMSDEQVLQMITQANSMVDLIKAYIPTLQYAINGILSNSIIYSLIEFFKLVGFTVISYIIYTVLAQKLYFKGLVGSLYSGIKKKKTNVNLDIKKTTIAKSYVLKEFKILFRNPVFLVQCVLPAILFPILITILLIMGNDGIQQLSELGNTEEKDGPILLFSILAIIQFFSMIIYVSATAISRDGANAVFMKYIPLSLYKQYIYKTIPNIIMHTLMIIVTLAITKYVINISLLSIIIIFIVSVIIAIFQSFLLLLVDLKRPKLQWSSEYAVVKQNMNLIFPMIFALINIGVILALISLMGNLNIYISIILIGILYAVFTFVLLKYMKDKQYQLARKII